MLPVCQIERCMLEEKVESALKQNLLACLPWIQAKEPPQGVPAFNSYLAGRLFSLHLQSPRQLDLGATTKRGSGLILSPKVPG